MRNSEEEKERLHKTGEGIKKNENNEE